MHRKRALYSLALILVFSGSAFLVAPQKASAVVSCISAIAPIPDIPVAVPVQSVGQAIRQNISNAFQASNFTKECILDALVTFLKESLIQNLTGSIVDWINSDFEGGPAFVTNPASFFVNIADETAGRFIETQLGPIGQLLCSPFDLQLRLHLWAATSASRTQYLGCRLSEVEQSVTNAFTEGSFIASGGWRTFHAVSSDPRNNQFGAFILASDALNTEYIKKANETLRDLAQGGGFLSYKKCIRYDPPPSYDQAVATGGKGPCAEYKVETPGSLINGQLNNVFGSELRKFELADEINEIFQALVNAGLRQVFAKGGGLRSVGVQQTVGTPRIIADSFSDVQRKAQGDTATTRAFNQGYTASSVSDTTLGKVNAEAGSAGTVGTQKIKQNLASGRPATQSDGSFYNNPGYTADHAVNNHKEGGLSCLSSFTFNCAAITGTSAPAWWEVSLEKTSFIEEIKIYKANDRSYQQALGDPFTVQVLDANHAIKFTRTLSTQATSPIPIALSINTNGKIVRIEKNGAELALAEVEVYGTEGETRSATEPPSEIVSPDSSEPPPETVAISPYNRSVLPMMLFVAQKPLPNLRIEVSVEQKVGSDFALRSVKNLFTEFYTTVERGRSRVKTFNLYELARAYDAVPVVIGAGGEIETNLQFSIQHVVAPTSDRSERRITTVLYDGDKEIGRRSIRVTVQ